VRRALAHAIDRKAVIEGAMSGRATPIGSHFSHLHPAYVDLTGRYPYDPALAKKLFGRDRAEQSEPDVASAAARLCPARGRDRRGLSGPRSGSRSRSWRSSFRNGSTRCSSARTTTSRSSRTTEPLDIDIYARDDYYFNYRSQPFQGPDRRDQPHPGCAGAQHALRDAQRMLAEDCVNVFLFQLPKLGVWNAKLDGLWENSPLQANDVTGCQLALTG